MPYKLNQCKTPKGNDLENAMDPKLWVMEPKIDGWRIQMSIDAVGNIDAWTRTEHDATGKLAAVETELSQWFDRYNLKRCIFDGEVVWLSGHDGSPDFSMTASIMGSGLDVCLQKQQEVRSIGELAYIVFDVFEFDGRDMTECSYDIRRRALKFVFFHDEFKWLQLMPTYIPSLDQHEWNISVFGEGSILKYKGAAYEGKRTKYWLKWKNAPDEDVVIMGFKPGAGKYTGQIGAIKFGQQLQGADGDACWQLTERGYCSGMTDSERLWISHRQEELIGKVMTIKTFGVLAQGGFRHPQFLRFREDKDPMECDWTS